MPIIESQIKTRDLESPLGGVYSSIKVFYTDELVETSVYDLAWSSASGGLLPYLFVGYFMDGKDFHQWYFSNARRHEEMQEAIEKDLGRKFECVYGQIGFNSLDLDRGKLRFDTLILHSNIPDQEQVLRLLFSAISPEDYDRERFMIRIAGTTTNIPVPREGASRSEA